VNSTRQKIAVVAAMIQGILFSLYGNCRDKIQALVQSNTYHAGHFDWSLSVKEQTNLHLN
jgi:hypothetical protein